MSDSYIGPYKILSCNLNYALDGQLEVGKYHLEMDEEKAKLMIGLDILYAIQTYLPQNASRFKYKRTEEHISQMILTIEREIEPGLGSCRVTNPPAGGYNK